MNKKWCLLKSSAVGPMGRGQNGKKKVYEVTLDGTTVTFEWGMAEKPQRQRQVRSFRSTQAALAAAHEKVYGKVAGGYRIAYDV